MENKQLEALNNAAKTIGGVVHEKVFEDRRKTSKYYFLTINNVTQSPVLNYENMNHFLLGWIKSKEYYK